MLKQNSFNNCNLYTLLNISIANIIILGIYKSSYIYIYHMATSFYDINKIILIIPPTL